MTWSLPRSGRLRPLLLIGAGATAATGFQPIGLWPLTMVALAVLIAAIDAAPRARGAASAGGWFGLGRVTVGDNWIATAFTYQAQMPAWLGWVAVVALSVYLAVFPALAMLAAWLLHRNLRTAMVPTLAACWVLGEWTRGWAFTGFAWNPVGVVTLGSFAHPGLARLAEWCGTYALSGLVVLFAGSWLTAWRMVRARPIMATGAAVLPAVLMLLPLAGDPRDSRLAYTLVQPDVPQDQINNPRLFEGQFRNLAMLSRRIPADGNGPRVVLWPEGAVPDYLRPGYDPAWYIQSTFGGDPGLARERMGAVIGPGSLLMTGATDLVVTRRQVTGAWNVITLIDPAGTIRGSYAKAHLVPYGEYLPMRAWLAPLGMSRLVSGELDFAPGPGARTIGFAPVERGGWGRAGFQICYEIVFPGHVIDRAHRPDYLFNPSNDGWFGAWGPPQHLAQARLRAIEEGMPILRSTTTGISAVIDAGGGVRQFIARGIAGRRDGRVPAVREPTLFARVGNLLSLIWAMAIFVIALVATRRQAR